MAVRIQVVFLLTVLAACAFGQDHVRIAVVTQSTGHGANGRQAIQMWANHSKVKDTKDMTVHMHYIDWVKADAAALIKPLTTKGSESYVDVLFGPYGSGDNIAMINEVDPSFEGVILVWGGASGSIFTDACASLGRCFGFFTTAAYYMNSGIQAVAAKDDEEVKIAMITNNNAFSKSVAAGAKMTIDATAGVKLIASTELDVAKSDLSEDDDQKIKDVIAMQPDMYVISGHNGDVEPVIMMIADSKIVPKAILATNSITSTALDNFAEMGGQDYVECVMMPTQWAFSSWVDSGADSIIGWTSHEFKSAMGDAGTYHSASAAAAAIAVSHAMTFGKSVTDILENFKALDFESFYGKISFNDHGEILKPMYTQQMQGYPVIVAPASGVNKGDELSYPLSRCGAWNVPPPITCAQVKEAYKQAECCGNPNKTPSGGRRLLGLEGSKPNAKREAKREEKDLLKRIKREVEAARATGGEAKAQEVANKFREKILPYLK